jgi:hypothetical protein
MAQASHPYRFPCSAARAATAGAASAAGSGCGAVSMRDRRGCALVCKSIMALQPVNARHTARDMPTPALHNAQALWHTVPWQ